MIAFAYVSSEGIPTGGGMRDALPDGAVVLPAPFTTQDLPRLMLRDGVWVWRDVEAEAIPPEAVLADRLAGARRLIVAQVNARVDAVRRRSRTVIAGQDALYERKAAEARAYVAATSQGSEPVSLEDYPLIAAEVGITAPEAWQVAQIWLHRSAAVAALDAATEAPRQAALAAIAEATSIAEIEAVYWRLNLMMNPFMATEYRA